MKGSPVVLVRTLDGKNKRLRSFMNGKSRHPEMIVYKQWISLQMDFETLEITELGLGIRSIGMDKNRRAFRHEKWRRMCRGLRNR